MQFGERATGCMLEYPPGLDAATVRARCTLPQSVQAAPAFEAWMHQVEDAAAQVWEMASDRPVDTPGKQAERLDALSVASHRMRNALAMLSVNGDRASLFELLQPIGNYVLSRARDGIGPSAGRPRVPQVETDAASFAAMLSRMAADLEALDLICQHQRAKQTGQTSSMPKHHERLLVRLCATSFKASFDKLPPMRGWFGDQFMPYVGQCIGLEIGPRIVWEVVAALKKDHDAP